jgi:ABC-2 type transport system permease protein
VAFFFLAPLVVMTLVYYALAEDKEANVAIVARGPSRLFIGEFENSLRKEKDIRIVSARIRDTLADSKAVLNEARALVRKKQIDAVIFIPQEFLADRFEGRQGQIHIVVEGTRPMTTGTVMSAISESMDDLGEALPVIAADTCSSNCVESFNNKTIDLNKIYVHTHDDFRSVDYYLPMFPALFVFFFTFITAAITLQRERTSGTMERLLAAPVHFAQLLGGYILGFAVFSGVQTAIILVYVFNLITFPVTAPVILAITISSVVCLIVGLSFGIFVSFISKSEFQVMQMIPVIILPQVFLSNMIWDIAGFPLAFRIIARAMPLTYANNFVRDTVLRGEPIFSQLYLLAIALTFVAVPLVFLHLVSRNRFN